MRTQKSFQLVLILIMVLGLSISACTRAASTAPPEVEGEGEAGDAPPANSQQATMDAVRSALLTQTAQAGGGAEATSVVPTSTPTPASAGEESPEATAPAEEIEYTVQEGDWLWEIALVYEVDPDVIMERNNLASPGDLTAGMVIIIPLGTVDTGGGVATTTRVTGGTVHVVQAGEWIWQIARQYGVDPQSIIDANDVANPSLIYPGMELVIPSQ
jgi:LysM repeat protein